MDNFKEEVMVEDDLPIEEDSVGESRNTPSAYDNRYKDSNSNSKETLRKNINNKKGTKKKQRRSRMILNEDFESVQEHKKEIYDVDTKYIKSLENGVIFNNFIASSRFQLSKHFLKRKIKSNFEREEKFPSFFNVSFLPKPEMFPLPPTTQQRSNMNTNMQMTKQGQSANNPSLGSIPLLPNQSSNNNNHNINQINTGNNTNANVNVNPSQGAGTNMVNSSNNKGLFNVNANKISINQPSQSTFISSPSSSLNQSNQDQKIIIPLNNQLQSSSMVTPVNSNIISDNHNKDNNTTIKPTTQSMTNITIAKNPNSNTHNNQAKPHNREEDKKLLQMIMEKYRTNPEGLRREYGDEKFMKIETILAKRGIIKLPHDPNKQPRPTQSNTISIDIPQITNSNSSNIIQLQQKVPNEANK